MWQFAHCRGGSVTIDVRDNGPGITPEAIDHLCDPFFTTKSAGEGKGLGLFLTYGIISEHRGRLEIQNGDMGAVFTVHVPAIAASEDVHEESTWESRAKS